MTRSNPAKEQRKTATEPAPPVGARSVRNLSLLILVAVDFIVALLMLASLVRYVVDPDPNVEAVPMYVTLALTTGAALLMLALALNASFFSLMSRRRAKDLRLIMWTMGATGIVTGLLTLGGAADVLVTRLFIGVVAFLFLRVQEARLERSGIRAVHEVAAPEGEKVTSHAKSRQRRGGRKH